MFDHDRVTMPGHEGRFVAVSPELVRAAEDFVRATPPVPVLLIFVGFMASTGFRNVAFNTLTSRVPRAVERARFMSIQSAAQHAASAVGAVASSQILYESATGRIEGIPTVAWFSIAMVAMLPALMFAVERRVKREAAAA